MLKSFQYAVGNDGLPQKKTKNIGYNILFRLPVIGSPAYTIEWGEKIKGKIFKTCKNHKIIIKFR